MQQLGNITKQQLNTAAGTVSVSFSAYPAVPGQYWVGFRLWSTSVSRADVRRLTRLVVSLGFRVIEERIWPSWPSTSEVVFDVYAKDLATVSMPRLGGITD